MGRRTSVHQLTAQLCSQRKTVSTAQQIVHHLGGSNPPEDIMLSRRTAQLNPVNSQNWEQ